MCWKYINPHDTVFIWCETANGKEHKSNYLSCFTDMVDDYYDNYNYCPYCGNKLEIKEPMSDITITVVCSRAKNIIFLDIDGVLNGYNKWDLLGWKIICSTKSKRLKRWYTKVTDPYGIHERKVKRLAKIVKATNAKVVMSGSWRFGWWNTPYEKQFADQRKLTDLLNKYNIEVIDITPRSSDGRRDKEIMEWLVHCEDMVKRFVILDDERCDLECFVGSHLVQTSSVGKGEMIMGFDREDTGLKNKHVRKAIEILRS